MTHTLEFILTIEAGGTIGQTFRLTTGTFMIGRAPTNQIVINHPAVSKEHAQLTVQPDGMYLADMGSSNGTFVNGRQISQSTWLKPGDSLRVGTEVTLKLHQGGVAAGGGGVATWLPAGILALASLLLLVGIGLGGWFFLSNRSATPQTTSPEPAGVTVPALPAPSDTPAPDTGAPAPAPDVSFTSDRTTVPLGECITLGWQTENVREVRLDGELVPVEGSRQVCPREPSKIYRLTAVTDTGVTIEQTVTVSVPPTLPPPPEVQVDFTADQPGIAYGSCTTLRWAVNTAQAVMLDGEKVALTGSVQVCPTAPSNSFRLSVLPLEGQPVERIIVVNVAATPMPSATPTATGTPVPTATSLPQTPGINKFIADQYNLSQGSCTILRWEVWNAHTVRLDGAVVAGQGSQQVCPGASTSTYTLTATGNGGTVQSSVTLTVLTPTHTPVIVAPPPPPSGDPIIRFFADETTIRFPNCTTIRWHVENVREIYLEGQDVPREGVTGDGSKRVCPSLSSSLFKLIIILRDGSVHEEKLYITVVG
jgi:hypothetical protein